MWKKKWENGKCYLENEEGKRRGPFYGVWKYNENWHAVRYVNGTSYLLDENGNEVLGPFNMVLSYFDKDTNSRQDDNRVCVQYEENGPWYFIDNNGKKMLGPYNRALPYSDLGRALVMYPEDKESWYFIDKNGKKVLGPYNRARDYSCGYFIITDEEEDVCYFMDGWTGEKIFGPFYDVCRFTRGYAGVVTTEEDSWQYVDLLGNISSAEGTEIGDAVYAYYIGGIISIEELVLKAGDDEKLKPYVYRRERCKAERETLEKYPSGPIPEEWIVELVQRRAKIDEVFAKDAERRKEIYLKQEKREEALKQISGIFKEEKPDKKAEKPVVGDDRR